MLYLSTALHWEARPFIDLYSLKRVEQQGSFEIFAADDICLVVTGIGKLLSATGSTLLFSRFPPTPESVAVNIGVCGASQESSIGEAYSVHRVIDQSSGKTYLPDMLVRSPFAEVTLETLDRPGTDSKQLTSPDHIADMEASGFFSAAFSFFSAEQIMCIKIASDALTCGVLNSELVKSLLDTHLSAITSYIASTRSALEQIHSPLSKEDFLLLEELCEKYRFTTQQRAMLLKSATGYSLRTEMPLRRALPSELPPAGTSELRKSCFQLLQRLFSHNFNEALSS